MATENPEKAFYEVEDGSAGDPKVEFLKGLLKSVQVNRRALGIIRAMKGGDKKSGGPNRFRGQVVRHQSR